MSRTHHRTVAEVWVEPAFGDGRRTERKFLARCSCGWYGTRTSIRARACREWHRHVAGPIVEVVEVAS